MRSSHGAPRARRLRWRCACAHVRPCPLGGQAAAESNQLAMAEELVQAGIGERAAPAARCAWFRRSQVTPHVQSK